MAPLEAVPVLSSVWTSPTAVSARSLLSRALASAAEAVGPAHQDRPYPGETPEMSVPAPASIGLHVSCEGVLGLLVPGDARGGKATAPACRSLLHTDVDIVVDAIREVVAEVLAGHPDADVQSASIAMGGHIDLAGQKVVTSPDLRDHRQNWRDVQLAALVEAATGLRTRLVHDVAALAAQEHAFGDGRGLDDFVVLLLGSHGVGCAVVANGAVVRGASGSAGEIGHCRLPGSRRICRCGRTGCLERTLSFQSIRAELDVGFDEQDLELRPQDLESRANRRVVTAAGQALGEVLAYALNVLNPEAALLHVPRALLGPSGTGIGPFADAVRETVQAHAVSDAAERCVVRWHELSPEFVASGAVTFARPRAPRPRPGHEGLGYDLPRTAARPRRSNSS